MGRHYRKAIESPAYVVFHEERGKHALAERRSCLWLALLQRCTAVGNVPGSVVIKLEG